MLELNTEVLNQVVEQACHSAAAHPRWLVAIGRAVVELISNPYLERQDGHLLIGSTSGSVYAANGVCQCKAYEFGQPCWHRAAARLVRLHDEALVQSATLEQIEEVFARQLAPLEARLAKATADMAELFS